MTPLDKLPPELAADYQSVRAALATTGGAAPDATIAVTDALVRLCDAAGRGLLRRAFVRRLAREVRRAVVETARGGPRIGATEVASASGAAPTFRAHRRARAAMPYTRSRPRWVGPLLEFDEQGTIVPDTADVLAQQRGWSAADSSPRHAGGLAPSERRRMTAGANVQCAADSEDVLAHLREKNNGLAALLRTGDRCPSVNALFGKRCAWGRLVLVNVARGELRCTECRYSWWARANLAYTFPAGE